MMVAKQRGSSVLAMMLWLLVGALALVCVIRIVPVYIDDFTLSRVIGSLEGSDHLSDASSRDIRDSIASRLELENIDAVDADDMDIEVGDTQVFIEFEYEVRTPFIANLDIVVGFEHYHELRIQ